MDSFQSYIFLYQKKPLQYIEHTSNICLKKTNINYVHQIISTRKINSFFITYIMFLFLFLLVIWLSFFLYIYNYKKEFKKYILEAQKRNFHLNKKNSTT